MSKEITISENNNPIYSIYIEKDYGKLSSILNKLYLSNGKILIVTDSNIGIHYAEKVKEIAEKSADLVKVLTLEPGEKHKNLDTVQKIYQVLIENKFDRKDVLIALGGGVIGDMTGFTAATYLRGIRFIQLPTSLLAMVDSSIGGKTGVDYLAYKNMVGSFHQPSAVYINLQVLDTLPEREFYSGFGEIIKHGLIKDKLYYEWLKEKVTSILNRDMLSLEQTIYQSCQIKKQVVESDPYEQGERALLNFGHTIGHSIEKLLDFSFLHGECVALGIVSAVLLSVQHEHITEEEGKDIIKTLKQYHLPVSLQHVSFSSKEVLEVTKNDKKMEAGKIKFILLHSIGEAYINREVSEEDMLLCIEEILGELKI